jgi:hypothetical protein
VQFVTMIGTTFPKETTMKVALSSFLALSVLAVAALAEDKKEPPKAPKNAALEQFKQLAGEWTGKEVSGMNEGQTMNIKYKVTSGGSAVMETIMPDSDHEMVTIIHPDGDELILTHYCMLGNQPQMKASAKGDAKEVAFKFTKATNLKSDKDAHMHDAKYTFVDKDTLRTEWTHYSDGKETGKVVFELKRKK